MDRKAAPTGAPAGGRMLRQLHGHLQAALAAAEEDPTFRELFTKYDHMVPMRDGVRLYTTIYVPKAGPDGLEPPPMPMLMQRTPYAVAPYSIDLYPAGQGRGDLKNYLQEGWMFVRQDVRGRHGSEGEFVHMRPHLDRKAGDDDVRRASTAAAAAPAVVASPAAGGGSARAYEIDESSDTFDTIEWLVNNVPNNNGRVGIMGISCRGRRVHLCTTLYISLVILYRKYTEACENDVTRRWLGISYPGFYSAAGMIDNHPALKCASPQAPINDFFMGDDFHHNGAFYLPHAFGFLNFFGKET
jgi:predicted acyl esterase